LTERDGWRPTIERSEFETLFGVVPVSAAEAFGRVNLIGEHTDYNEGFVLPTAIPQATTAAIAPRTDRVVRAWSSELRQNDRLDEYLLGWEEQGRGWLDYVQGLTRTLVAAGHSLHGFDLALRSNVPVGSGLSSSAALEIAVLRALRHVFALECDDVVLARLGQRAENEFVGAPVGIMDQMACSLARPGVALFIDTRSLAYQHAQLPGGTELVVINSGVAHNHAAGDYRTRRAECERAAAALGVAALRDVGVEALDRIMALEDPINRRARHVVTENQRVLDAIEAMRVEDAAALGRLFSASHASQRDDFGVSVPEIDLLVELAESDPAVFGARLTGGGFGGSIVALVKEADAGRVAAAVAAEFKRRTSRQATVLVP
jgi:galactokinase